MIYVIASKTHICSLAAQNAFFITLNKAMKVKSRTILVVKKAGQLNIKTKMARD